MSQVEDHDGTRRDFLYYATAGAGAVTAGAAIWPLVNQMNPSADVLAQASIPVDVSSIEPGTQLTVLWQGKPVFIRRRTEEEITAAREVSMDELPDPIARNANGEEGAPATDENRALDESGEWLVETAQGTIRCEHVVNAGGTYARQMGEWSGLQLPMTSMTHHYFVTEPVPEFADLETELPVIRDDKKVAGYIRMEH